MKHVVSILLCSLMGSCLYGCRIYPKPRPVPTDPVQGHRPIPEPAPVRRVPDNTENHSQEETGIVTADDELTVQKSREELAEAVAYYLLDETQVGVLSTEALDEYGLGDHVAQRLREHFSELGMRVQNVEGSGLSSTGARAVRELARSQDLDLIVVALGTADKGDNFEGMLRYDAEIRATVYEAGGHIVVTKELSKAGERSSKAKKAAKSALTAAADELGPFLVEQILSKVGQNVVTRRLTITGLRGHDSATRVVAHLRGQAGINDVRLLSWDEDSDTARIILYLQPGAQDNLGSYLTRVPKLSIRIEAENRRGLKGRERRIDR